MFLLIPTQNLDFKEKEMIFFSCCCCLFETEERTQGLELARQALTTELNPQPWKRSDNSGHKLLNLRMLLWHDSRHPEQYVVCSKTKRWIFCFCFVCFLFRRHTQGEMSFNYLWTQTCEKLRPGATSAIFQPWGESVNVLRSKQESLSLCWHRWGAGPAKLWGPVPFSTS